MSYDDHYARWSYEQLLLRQPHIEFRGLWRLGHLHFIVCPQIETAKTAEGTDLRPWFNHNCRVITAPVQLVASSPPDAEQVPERSATDYAALSGAPRTRRDILVDLGIALPSPFPAFTLQESGHDILLLTKQPLTPEQIEQARLAYASLGCYPRLDFHVNSEWDIDQDAFRNKSGQGDIDLIPSRHLPGSCGQALRSLVEEDEQFWADNKNEVLTTFHVGATALLPDQWVSPKKLGCFVDATVFQTENIRTYLSLYDTVHLALPLENTFEANCRAMGITQKELCELVETDRLKVVLPQPIDRYPVDWINEVADAAPQNLLLSRRLAAATIADARRRVPILYPPLGPAERYRLLHAAAAHAEALAGSAKKEYLIRFVAQLGQVWSQAEWSVQSRGAMGTGPLGIGSLAAAIYQEAAGQDLRLEFWTAAQKVEWAAVLGSHAFPFFSEGYNETAACDLVASIYNPPLGKQHMVARPTELSAITGLLAVDNRVSVIEFAKEFSSATIRRLRDIVLRLTYDNPSPENLAEAIQSFNAEVHHYEKRPDRLTKLNIVGVVSAGALAAGDIAPSLQTVVPLAGVLLGFVLNCIIDEVPRRYANPGRIIDFLNSALTGRAHAGAVLVARVRKDVSRLKNRP